MKAQRGVSLVELMIALLIGVSLLAASLSLLLANSASLALNEAVASVQENGRYALAKLAQQIRLTGRYNPLDPTLSAALNVADERAHVVEHGVAFPGAYQAATALGSRNGANATADTLVIGGAAYFDCVSDHHGYGSSLFYAVNEFYLEGHALKCRGYSGRALRGETSSTQLSATLVENVADFQVLYGVAYMDPLLGTYTGQPSAYVTADRAAVAVQSHQAVVVAIQLALLLFSDEAMVKGSSERAVKVLDTPLQTPSDRRLYRVFEQTLWLRNVWHAAVFNRGGV